MLEKRAIIFAHFDKVGLLDPHVEFMLTKLRPHCAAFIFVSTSILPAELKKAEAICDIAIGRDNAGYDFVSWKIGLHLLEGWADFDEIIFINDSLYGPLFDLDLLFRKVDRKLCDIWGMTFSYQTAPHLQSFFFSFRKSVIETDDFKLFWTSVEVLESKDDIIYSYEVGMTEFFKSRGFSFYCLFDPKKLPFIERAIAVFINGPYGGRNYFGACWWFLFPKRPRNPMHVYWRSVLRRGVPFIKVDLLRDNPRKINLHLVTRYLNRLKSYDKNIISRHVERVR